MSESATRLVNSVVEKPSHSIAQATVIQVCFTFLSRVAGMLRDVLFFHFFGATGVTDAFVIAFTIPNILRRFFGEGALGVAFVPIFLQTKQISGEKRAQEFFKDTLGILILSLSVITILGVICSPILVYIFASGFSDEPDRYALTVYLTRFLFSYVLLISIVALFGSYLQCYRKFAAMAAAPILLNICMILSMLGARNWFKYEIFCLVLGVLLGGCLQVFFMIWAARANYLSFRPSFNFANPVLFKLAKLMGPALFGIFVYQLNIIILRQLASYLGPGNITYYYNADRLAQFAIGVFAVSVASAVLPELSQERARKNLAKFVESLKFALNLTSFVVTPCAVGLIIFSFPVISILYFHGAFNLEDTQITARTLVAFAPSIIFFGLSRPLIQAYYALGDTKTPVLVGVFIVIINFTLGILLIKFGIVGLALTLSVSSLVQFAILFVLFCRIIKQNILKQIMTSVLLHVLLALLVSLIGRSFIYWSNFNLGSTPNNIILIILVAMGCGCAYLFLAKLCNLNEAQSLFKIIQERLDKISGKN